VVDRVAASIFRPCSSLIEVKGDMIKRPITIRINTAIKYKNEANDSSFNIILQPLIDVKDCTHYCGAHVQVKTMETSCEVVLS
jgi:hypothetical protein